jgi:hypothetical protein
MRYLYVSRPGGEPLNVGINAAKRRAKRLDKQDRLKILQVLGAGMPQNDIHHSELVRSRHRSTHQAIREEIANSQSDTATEPKNG